MATTASSVLLRRAPTPGVAPGQYGEPLNSAYFVVQIDAAANLLEAREYQDLPRSERLAKALLEQQTFLSGLLDPDLQAALDLRIAVHPGRPSPVEIAIVGRCWNADQGEAARRADALRHHIAALLPRHVSASLAEDPAAIAGWLRPLKSDELDSVQITKREVVAAPSRPDAKVAYYFSVVPFNWVNSDWTGVFSALAAARVPVVVSVALLPVHTPASFAQRLDHMATLYGRLAREDDRDGGLFFGRQKLAPDAFAVDAERAFHDFGRRYRSRAFIFRAQISAEGRIPPGLAELVAGSASPIDDLSGQTPIEHERAASAFEIRHAREGQERELARWNLEALDLRMLPGSERIWQREDPPTRDLKHLCVLADARDANCIFRLPVALDGTVPGFQVRRGRFGHGEVYTSEGPAIELGTLPGGGAIRFAVRSLTKHALIAGSTGSGKTTTVLELLHQLWRDHRVPFLVIEPVNSDADDYRKLLGRPGFEALEVFTAGDESLRPLRFNPFEVPQNVLVSEHIANLLACFKAAFGLWEPLPSIYQEALDHTYLAAGILSSERAGGEARNWPTVVEFRRAMRQVTANLGYAGEVKHNIEAASIRRAEQLTAGTPASTFLTNRPNDIARLLERPVILELKSLGSGDEQALMIALLLNAITEHYQAVRGASSELAHVTVIEEAHRLLARSEGGRRTEEAQAKEKAAEAFANSLAENRKYGEGMVIAEQLPTKLVADAVKNTNLKVMHRLTAEEDRRYLGETMGLDEPQMRFATRLLTGEALLYGDEFPEAAHVKVMPQLSEAALTRPAPVAVPPFAACGPCRAKCAYRGASLAMVRDARMVDGIQEDVRFLERRDTSAAERADRWESLLESLHGQVRAFPALPSQEPGLTDAAYCLFLHSLAIRRMDFSPAWPAAVAKRLGMTKGSGDE